MEDKILEILKECNEELLTYTGSNMLRDGLVESYSFITLISDIEDAFDIEIDEDFLDGKHFGNKDRIIETIKFILEG